MSQHQAGVNAAAVRSLAAQLEQLGYRRDDVLDQADRIARRLIADGYRHVEPIPARGNGGSEAARAAARQATADAVAAAKARHQPQLMATDRQLTKLAILLSEDGISDRAARLDWCGALVGRDLTSTSDLTRGEATRLIDTLDVPLPAEPLLEGETP